MRYFMLVFMALALAVAGCSGTDDPAVDADVDVEATAEGDSAEADVAVDAEASGNIDAEQCQQVAEALQSVPAAMAGAATGNVDAEAVQAQAEAFQEVADQVPDEISGDFQVVADAFDEIATTLGEVDLSSGSVSPEDQAALQELSSTLSGTDFTTASTNIGEYFTAGCQ